jgi:prepilin-type N-terminal cleavage/methylation domain-containing protein
MRPGDRTSERGFTIVEMLIVVTILSLVALLANTSFRNFRERAILNRAARVVATDMALTRSLAIRERQNVSLVADESGLTYAIRNANGDTLAVRSLDSSSDFAVDSLNVLAAGDSITFNSRGLLLTAVARVDVGRASGDRQVQVNGVGRARIIKP